MPGLLRAFSSKPGIAAAGRSKKKTVKGLRRAIKATKETRRLATGDIAKYLKQGVGAAEKYTAKGAKALAAPLTNLQDVYNQEQMGRGAYFDILGLGGQEGADRAQQRFDTSLQMPTHLAEQSILRNQAAAGGLRGGGTSTDLADYTRENIYTPYVNRFATFNPLEAATAQGNLASNLASLYGTTGSNLLSANTNAGNNLAQTYVSTNPATQFQNIGAAKAGFEADKFGAQQGALSNQWAAINTGLGLGTKLLGLGFG